MIYGAILVCEVSFWLFLGAGLLARYHLGQRLLGILLLMGSPFADVVLLVLTALHLHGGAAPTQAHALAAGYLGVTLAFGHSLVKWADRHAAFRLAGGPRPVKHSRTGSEKLRYEWREFGKATIAWLVTCLILLVLALFAGADDAQVLLGSAGMFTMVLVIWFATGPLPAALGARRQREVAGLQRTSNVPDDVIRTAEGA